MIFLAPPVYPHPQHISNVCTNSAVQVFIKGNFMRQCFIVSSKARPIRLPLPSMTGLPLLPPVMSFVVMNPTTRSFCVLSAYCPKSFLFQPLNLFSRGGRIHNRRLYIFQRMPLLVDLHNRRTPIAGAYNFYIYQTDLMLKLASGYIFSLQPGSFPMPFI